MRILHTSDWHLGQELYNYKREDEHLEFFRQLTDYVQEFRPDVMVVSGDIFHTAMPSAATRRLYVEALLKIHQAKSDMMVVVTAGNHDSAARLEVDSSLWQFFSVHVVGALRRDGQKVLTNEHIITVPGKGFIVAVPHVYPQNIPLPAEDGNRMRALFTNLLQRTAELNIQKLPVVVMAHLAVDGCDITGHQNSLGAVGGMDFEPVSVFNGHYDYVALGHIHRQQSVPTGNKKVRYSGTPVAVHFDEDYVHAISIIDVDYNAEPKVQSLPVVPLRPLLTIPEKPVDFDVALEMLNNFDPEKEAYIRLYVNLNDGLPPDCSEKAANVVKGKKCRFCTFKRFENIQHKMSRDFEDISPDQLRDLSPLEVARRYMESKGFSKDLSDKYVEMMDEVMIKMKEQQQ